MVWVWYANKVNLDQRGFFILVPSKENKLMKRHISSVTLQKSQPLGLKTTWKIYKIKVF